MAKESSITIQLTDDDVVAHDHAVTIEGTLRMLYCCNPSCPPLLQAAPGSGQAWRKSQAVRQGECYDWQKEAEQLLAVLRGQSK